MAQLISQVVGMADAIADDSEIEINPCGHPTGQGVTMVDALVVRKKVVSFPI